ncbi:hypothetical protein [Nitriliruptor alkaliphilus]|uniref:hypothetical protein n=1 Tax=Nitriliruptor alkaliphilus TaxID=427918 RepID=UPI000698DF95|nr:hypothetical protein [Nitriliruptor alkaliphilus]
MTTASAVASSQTNQPVHALGAGGILLPSAGATTVTLDIGDATEVQLLLAAENADVTATIDRAPLVDEVVWGQDLLSWSGPVSGSAAQAAIGTVTAATATDTNGVGMAEQLDVTLPATVPAQGGVRLVAQLSLNPPM